MSLFVRNPFRSDSPRRAFAAAVDEYEHRDKALFRGKHRGKEAKVPHKDSAYASAFWLGYEQGVVAEPAVPRGTRAWIAWRAGAAVAEAERISKAKEDQP